MKILYGVSGEGFGHSSRANEIISHLESVGHEVLVVTYGQAYDVLKDKYKTLKIEGIRLQFKDSKLMLSDTIIQGIKDQFENLKNSDSLKMEIDSFNPSLCITDYEPITAIVSFWRGLPLISIDNQHLFTHAKIDVPEKYSRDYLLAKTVTDQCVSRAQAFIIFTFLKEENKRDVFFVDLLIRKEVQELNSTKGDYVLVYQTKPDNHLLDILKKIPEKFVVYGYDEEREEENLILKKKSPDFINMLAGSKAVISSAGLSLLSEAVYLRKPFFAIPLAGQFEQTFNALFLTKAGYGDWSENPEESDINNFLQNLEKYEKSLGQYEMNPQEVFGVLDGVIDSLKV